MYLAYGHIYLEKLMYGAYHKQMTCFNQTRFLNCCCSLDSSLIAGISRLQEENQNTQQILIYHLDELSLIDEPKPTTTLTFDIVAEFYCLSLAFSTDNQYILAAFGTDLFPHSICHLQIWHIVQQRVCFDGPYKPDNQQSFILSFSYTIKDDVQAVLAINMPHRTFIHTIDQEENGMWKLSTLISIPYLINKFIPHTVQLACVANYHEQPGCYIKFYDFTPYGPIYSFNKMLAGSIDIPTIDVSAILRIAYQPTNQKLILMDIGNNVYIYDYQTKQLEHQVHLAENIINYRYERCRMTHKQLYYQPIFDTELCDKLRSTDQLTDDVSMTDKE